MRMAIFLVLLQTFYRMMLRAFPADFRTAFGEEMTEMFAERLAEAAAQGGWAMVMLSGRELGQWPAALLRSHLYIWQKKRQRMKQFWGSRSLFGVPPLANDGRSSTPHLLLELLPFLFTASLIVLLTYQPQANRPAPLDVAVWWAGALPLLALLLGLARGMPRWAYPYGGLLAGYALWLAADQRLVWLWVLLMFTSISLAILALFVNRGERPLPAFFQQIGASIALDWTRLSFGVFGAAPLLILAAFDNAFLNQRTPYLALALLIMVLTALVYSRRRRQDLQMAALLSGTTLLFVPALLDNVYWLGWGGSITWLLALWAWIVVLLWLPLISVPAQFIAADLPPGHGLPG